MWSTLAGTPPARRILTAPRQDGKSLRMRLLAKKVTWLAKKGTSSATSTGGSPYRFTGDEWQGECERLTAYLERAYAADEYLEHDDDEQYDAGHTVGQVLTHYDGDAELRKKEAAAKRQARRVAEQAAAERQEWAAAQAEAVRRQAEVGMAARLEALEAARVTTRSPPPAPPSLRDRPHEGGALVSNGDEDSCTLSRYRRWRVTDDNRELAEQMKAERVARQQEADVATAAYHARRHATTQALRVAAWGEAALGATGEGRSADEGRAGRAVDGGAAAAAPPTSPAELRSPSSPTRDSKANQAVRESQAQAARVAAEGRRRRDEQSRLREDQQHCFHSQQRQSQEKHGTQQRRRTMEAQRESMEKRAEAAARVKEHKRAQTAAARSAVHEAEERRRAALAKARKDNQGAREMSRFDRPGLTAEGVDARDFASKQRREAGQAVKGSVQAWEEERREAIAAAAAKARANAAAAHAIRRSAAAARANVIATRREEAQQMRSSLQQQETQLRLMVVTRVGLSKSSAQVAYDHKFVAAEHARQVAASEWARVGAKTTTLADAG